MPQAQVSPSRPAAGATRDVPWPIIIAVASGAGVLLIFVVMCAGIARFTMRVAETVSDAPYSSGTGFVVHPEGYILTNHHVIEGPGDTMVRLANTGDNPIPTEVVVSDAERDIALLRMALPGGLQFQSLEITAQEVGRGSRVAAFGYPLGDALGSRLKLTTGVVSALPDSSNENMLLLDCTVNPGNSGGPLCNGRGDVVGMVTAKSITGYGVDSYGMAIPAPQLLQFLRRHLPAYAAQPSRQYATELDWEAVDRRVSPAVLMVLKM
jgi:serine protease Do